MERCPLCKEEVWLADCHEAAVHVFRKHQDTILNEHKLWHVLIHNACWCGKLSYKNLSTLGVTAFAEHLEERGGLTAHIFEIVLGQ